MKQYALYALMVCLMCLLSSCAYLAMKTATTNLPTGTMVDDLWLEHYLDYELAQLAPENAKIEVIVYGRRALIAGYVPDNNTRLKLLFAIKSIDTIKGYYDFLHVTQNIPDFSSTDDFFTTTRIKTNLLGEINPMHFNILTLNGTTYVMGYANATDKQTALHIISHTRGVQHVIDVIKPYPKHIPAMIRCVSTVNRTCPLY